MESTTGENEKRLLASVLKERLIEGKNTIIYKELLEHELPVFLKNFLQNRVQKYFQTNEPFQFKNSKRYDFNYDKIKILKNELFNAFEEATLFTKDEIDEIIYRTIGLQFDLLVKPNETLLKIFYKNKSERTQSDILKILTGLSDNRKFIHHLIDHIKDFDQFHIIQDEFLKIVYKTHDEVYKNNFLEAFISDVKAFLDFLSHIKGNEEKSINREILKLLLTERNMEQYYVAFNSTNYESDWIDIHEVATLLSSYIEKKESSNKSINREPEIIEDFITSFKDNEDSRLDYYTVIDEERQEIETSTTEFEYDKEKHHPRIEAWIEPQDFIINREMIEHQPEVPLLSLDILIDEKSKRLIQKKIFKKDCDAYDNFVKRLDEIDNWKKAKQIIDDELMLRSIQPFSREALILGDIVFNRYFPKNNS